MLSSARMRRRLLWIGAIAGLVGMVVLLAVVVFPSSKPWSAAKMSNEASFALLDVMYVSGNVFRTSLLRTWTAESKMRQSRS